MIKFLVGVGCAVRKRSLILKKNGAIRELYYVTEKSPVECIPVFYFDGQFLN